MVPYLNILTIAGLKFFFTQNMPFVDVPNLMKYFINFAIFISHTIANLQKVHY